MWALGFVEHLPGWRFGAASSFETSVMVCRVWSTKHWHALIPAYSQFLSRLMHQAVGFTPAGLRHSSLKKMWRCAGSRHVEICLATTGGKWPVSLCVGVRTICSKILVLPVETMMVTCCRLPPAFVDNMDGTDDAEADDLEAEGMTRARKRQRA